jgi:hypothetical protein
MADEKLMAYFKFDEADLQANKEGRFSEKQKERLAAMDQSNQRLRKLLAIILICVGVGSLVALPFLVRDLSPLICWVPVGLLGGLLGVYLLRTSSGKNKKYKLRKMQGKISYSRHINSDKGYKENGYWIIHVGKSWFYVSENVPTILKEGAEYSVYTYAFQAWTYILTAELATAADAPALTSD